jgi:hypothetical protein
MVTSVCDAAQRCARLVQFTRDGDAGLAKDVSDLRDAEAGSVIFKRKLAFGIVERKAAKAVGVGKFSQGAELIVG